MTELSTKNPESYFAGKDWVHQLGFCAPDDLDIKNGLYIGEIRF